MSRMLELSTLLNGNSYWKATLASGRRLCELDTLVDIKQARSRKTEWLEDIIGSGDIKHVREVRLCTPQGEATIQSEREYGFFQLSCGILSALDGERTKTAQIVGCLDGDDGSCVVHIWDALTQLLYADVHTNVLDFGAWRAGVIPLGRLNIEALGVIL
jgi:hypothetical protein